MGQPEGHSALMVGVSTMKIRFRRAHLGFALSCFSGAVGLGTIFLAPANSLLALFTLVILPFTASFLLTGRFTDALTLTWVNEIFFGASGHWIELGPISGRWILLVTLILLTAVQAISVIAKRGKNQLERPWFTVAILFYGAVLPIWLVLYSVAGQGTPFWRAVGDVNYLYVLLAYFPLRHLVQRERNLFRGWIIGGVLVLGSFFILFGLAPRELAVSIFQEMAGETQLGTTASGINRAAMVAQVLLFIGVFLGSLYAADIQQGMRTRVAGMALTVISIASLILFFLRGPLLSLVAVVVFFVLATSQHREMRSAAVRILIPFVIFAATAYLLYSQVVPEALDKFTIIEENIRVDQADRMLVAFRESPFGGQGAGVPLPGFSRTSEGEGLAFELQYHMLLYRLGLINFSLLLGPVVWFFCEPFRLMRSEWGVFFDRDGKLLLAVLLSLVTILIAGAANPYLVAIFTPFHVILYLSLKEIVITSMGVPKTIPVQ